MSQTQTADIGMDSFAAMFEESLQKSDMRAGEVISAEVIRVEHSFVVVNAGLKSEAYVPIEEFKNDQGELEVQVGDFVSVAIDAIENGYGDTILSRDKAKRLASWLSPGNRTGVRRLRDRHRQRQGQGRPDRSGQRHPRLPAGLSAGHASGQGHEPVRRQDHGVQGHQAGPQAQQRRVVAPCCGRSFDGRRARQAAGNPVRRRHRQRRGQEHHRIRRVRGPGRYRRSAAHHRHGMAPCPSPVGSRDGWPGTDRQGPEVRRREEPRLAGSEAAGRRSVVRRCSPLPDQHPPVRQGHQHR